MSGYLDLSKFYDKLNAGIDYSVWADGIEATFERFLPEKPEIVLDLACGTGKMTAELARRGYDMIGVDLSAEMLSVAARDRSAKNILWLMQDMRSFELYGSVGAVVCCLDAVNCLLTTDDLKKCFSTVHNYLDPNGLFIFDVNSPYKFENVFADNAYILEEDGVFCGWRNFYNKKTRVCDFYLTFFEKKGEKYERYDENQREKCYSEKQLESALKACGFCVCGFFGSPDLAPVADDTERIFVVAQKI